MLDPNDNHFNLYYKLRAPIDVYENKGVIYSKIHQVVTDNNNKNIQNSFVEVLQNVDITVPDKPVSIQWTFNDPFLNMMKNKIDFGDHVEFGNFITLVRSNYDWYIKLKQGVDLFGGLYDIYMQVINDIEVQEKYQSLIDNFSEAIKFGLVREFYSSDTGMLSGYAFRYGFDEKDEVVLDYTSWKFFDKKYALYNLFTTKVMQLSDNEIAMLDQYLGYCKMNPVSDARDAALKIYDVIKATLNDAEYLGNRSEVARERKFSDAVKMNADESYGIPDPSDGNKDITTVINNIFNFYDYMYKFLKNELGSSNQ